MTTAALAAAAGMAVLGTYYFRNKKTHKRTALLCKASATALPGLLMLYWFFQVQGGSVKADAPFIWTLAAILCYMTADVLLEYRFVVGAVCFSAGHLCMIVSFLAGGVLRFGLKAAREPLLDSYAQRWIMLLPIAETVLFLICTFDVFRKYIPRLKAKRLFVPAAAYVTVLCVMAGLASAAGLTGIQGSQELVKGAAAGLLALIPAVGGCCFFLSDILLGINRLGKKRSRVRGAFVLILYYAAVYLYAMRIWG